MNFDSAGIEKKACIKINFNDFYNKFRKYSHNDNLDIEIINNNPRNFKFWVK